MLQNGFIILSWKNFATCHMHIGQDHAQSNMDSYLSAIKVLNSMVWRIGISMVCGIGILPGTAWADRPELNQPKTSPLHFPEIFRVHVRIQSPPNQRNRLGFLCTLLRDLHPILTASILRSSESGRALGVAEVDLKFIASIHHSLINGGHNRIE